MRSPARTTQFSICQLTTGSLRAQHTSNQNPTLCPICIIRMARVVYFFRCLFTFICGFCLLHVHNSYFVPKVCVCVCVSQGNELYISAYSRRFLCVGWKRFIIILAFMEKFLLIRVSFKPIAEHSQKHPPTDLPIFACMHINKWFSIVAMANLAQRTFPQKPIVNSYETQWRWLKYLIESSRRRQTTRSQVSMAKN